MNFQTPISFEYLAAITPVEIEQLKADFESVNIPFKANPTHQRKTKYFDSYSASNTLIIKPPQFDLLITDSSAELWDSLIPFILKIKQLLKGYNALLGIQIQLDANTIFNVKLDASFDENTTKISLLQLIEFMAKQKPNVGYGHNPFFVYYDSNKKEWKKVEVMDLIEEDDESSLRTKPNNKQKKRRR